MEEINGRNEYLLHTCMDYTWEREDVIEEMYSKFVFDYRSRISRESDVTKEVNLDEVHSTNLGGPFSSSGNCLTGEGTCWESDNSVMKDSSGDNIA